MNGWIGVDLDGTLAHYNDWVGIEHIGDPIPKMIDRVKKWLANGEEVRIFTARAQNKDAIPHIAAWLNKYGLAGLKITNVKDYGMIELWDDRSFRVITNTGETCCNHE